MLAFLIIVLAIGLGVSFLISWFQLVSFYINYVGSGATGNSDPGFWNTGNFWAWVIAALLFIFFTFLLKIASVLVNRLILFISYFVGSRKGLRPLHRLEMISFLIVVFWFIFSIYAASELFHFLASFPSFTDWFTPDNWFAGVLLMGFIFGITARFKVSDDKK